MSNDGTAITWEDPPPAERGRGGGQWKRAAALLAEKPNVWACVATFTDGLQANGAVAAMKRHGCEATQRKVSDTEVKVYARFLPENVEP